MRTITKSFPVYKFGEAPEEVKKKILEKYRGINIADRWWSCLENDLKTIGLELRSLDWEHPHASLRFESAHVDVCEAILKNHGECCGTHKVALAYRPFLLCPGMLPHAEREFSYALEREYAKLVRAEYLRRISDEAVIETLVCNDYEFTEDGKIYA